MADNDSEDERSSSDSRSSRSRGWKSSVDWSSVDEKMDKNVGLTRESIEGLKLVTAPTIEGVFEETAVELLAELQKHDELEAKASVLAEVCARRLSDTVAWSFAPQERKRGKPVVVARAKNTSSRRAVVVFDWDSFLPPLFHIGKTDGTVSVVDESQASALDVVEASPTLAVKWDEVKRANVDDDQGNLTLRLLSPKDDGRGKESFSWILLWKGSGVDQRNVALLLQSVVKFVTSSETTIDDPATTWHPYGQRTVLRLGAAGGDCAFKLYDERPYARGHNARDGWRLNSQLTASKLHATREVQGDDLLVLKYDWIHGRHDATHVKHFLSAIEGLGRFHHEDNLIHGDIRAANMIFTSPPGDDEPACFFIDFDFAGNEHRRYPQNYNTELYDVERHPDAYGGALLKKEHDWYALASVMELHRHDDSEAWADICSSVQAGSIDSAIASIARLSNTRLTFSLPLT